MSSNKTIYVDVISESLGIRPITDFFPDYNFNVSAPEDSASNTPKGMPMDYYFAGTFAGHTHTDEYKEQLSGMMTERRKDNPQMGNFQPHTDETKAILREKSMGNTNGRVSGYTLSDEFKENKRQYMHENNPMDNPESVAKLSASMKVKKKCPHCDMMGSPATLARHIKARHA